MSTVVPLQEISRPTMQAQWRGLASVCSRILGVSLLVSGVVIFSATADGYSTRMSRIAFAVAAGVLLGVGWALAGERKRLVLYLRRFGETDRSTLLQRLFVAHARRRYRLVTLDGSDFDPVSVSRRARMAAYSTTAFGGLAIGGLVGFFFFGLFAIASTSQLELGVGGEGLAAFFLESSKPELALLATVFVLFLALFTGAWTGITRSISESVLTAPDLGAWAKARRQVASLRQWRKAPQVFGPVATLLQVDSGFWREAVEQVALDADVVLIDIVEPSPNVVWELEHVLEHHPEKLVLLNASRPVADAFGNGLDIEPQARSELQRLPLARLIALDGSAPRGLRAGLDATW